MKLDRKDKLIGMLFISFLAMSALVLISQQDAGFYCENYCNASGVEFIAYSHGNCVCSSMLVSEHSWQTTDTFKNVSQVLNIT